MKLSFYSLRLGHRHSNNIKASADLFLISLNQLRKVSENDTLRT